MINCWRGYLTMGRSQNKRAEVGLLRHPTPHLLVAQEKLAGAVQAFVQHELNFHLQEYLANASDLLVRMPKVVRRFEEMRRTESDAFSYARGT